MFGVDDAALAVMLSGAMSTAGSLYANNNNAALARSQLDYQKFVNDVNWAIAAENNATQVEMANTAHQREVADLRRAGLNPILSAGGNGASVPSLTTPGGHVIGAGSPYSNPLEGAASSARSLGRFFGQQYQAALRSAEANASSAESDALQASWDASTARQRAAVERQDLRLREQAVEDLTTKWIKEAGTWRQVFDPDSEYYKNYKEGLMAEALDRTNVNWRANLGAITGAVRDTATSASSLGMGSAALMRATRALRTNRRP